MLEGHGVWAPVGVEGEHPQVLIVIEDEVRVIAIIDSDDSFIKGIGSGEESSCEKTSHFILYKLSWFIFSALIKLIN